jgi:hypothetical protein
MEATEAKRWMKLCVDSGLWVPQDKSIFEKEEIDESELEEVNGEQG